MSSRDFLNKKFDDLTVIEKIGSSETRYNTWLCQCLCGNTILVDTRRLVRGTVRNCGCKPKPDKRNGRIAEDITNQRFTKLVALERVESLKGRTRWFCQCDCGNTIITTTKSLKEGKTISCGCIRSVRPYGNYNDLTGKKFGRLTVKEITSNRDYKGSIYWLCECECGNKVEATNSALMSGNIISCGCRKREIKDAIHSQLTFLDNTCIEFLKNRKHRCDNTSGFRGVSQRKNGYRVSIGFKGKNYYLGTYKSFDDAKRARIEAEDLIHNQFIQLFEKWKNDKHKTQDKFEFNVKVVNKKVYIDSPYLHQQANHKQIKYSHESEPMVTWMGGSK